MTLNALAVRVFRLLAVCRPWTLLAAGLLALPVTSARAVCTDHVECDDSDPCTDDYCSDAGCEHVDVCSTASAGDACEVDANCDDGVACTTGTCGGQAQVGCKQWVPVCICSGFACATNPACIEMVCADPLVLGVCSIAAKDCDDGNFCTADACAEPGGCSHTPLANGTSCDDGDSCSLFDACSSGTCQGVPKNCTDGITCTTDVCADNNGSCVRTSTITPGTCHIAGVCYANLQVNPSDPCSRCEWAVSQTSWTPFQAPELCNGQDDDCDGLVDEGFNLLTLCDGPDLDGCNEEGGWMCEAETGAVYCADGPVGMWLHTDSGPGLAFDDSGFEHHGTVVDGAWDEVERAMYFNGTSTHIEIPATETLKLSSGFTLEAWIRPQAKSTYWGGILGQVRSASRYSYTVRLGGLNSPFFIVQTGYGCDSALYYAFNGATLTLDGTTWHHMAVTVDWDGRQRIYLDGQLDQDRASCGENTGTTDNLPVYIGRRADSVAADYYKGWMRRVALFNYARTQQEISLSAGLGGMPDTFFNAERCDYIDNDCDGLTDEGFPTGTACDASDKDTCSDDTRICHPNGFEATCDNAGPMGYFPFEEGAGSTAWDYAGEGRNGTLLGDAAHGVEAAVGSGALATSGTGGIEWSTAGLNGNTLTVAAWIRPAGWAGGDNQIHSLFQTNAVPQTPGWFSVSHDASGNLVIQAGAAAQFIVDATGLLPADTWTHLAVSWSRVPGRMRLYVNGALHDEIDDLHWLAATLPSLARFGRSTTGVNGWVGQIDEAVVYSRELPAANVATLAMTGVPAKHINKEICDGVDNECDGATDQFFPLLGAACDTDDADTCKLGKFTCAPNGLSTHCASETAYDVQDICNGLDDDCDGQTDEDYPLKGQDCDGADVDLCLNGTYTCKGDGSGVECVNESPNEVPELCNGADDDCDGAIDEDFTTLGADCDGADSDFCENGTFTCRADGAGVECVNESPVDIVEVCNLFDDDCDGLTDETFPTLNAACDGADSDFCANGTFTCRADTTGVECVNESPVNIVDVCNGADDDCDGQTDEDFPTLGNACDGPDSDLCKNGALECNGAGTGVVCGAESVVDIAESCNGADDDCDGQTDEDFPTKGAVCDGADTDQCQNGTLTCRGDGSGVECVNEAPANIAESCNGVDDDCDGSTDEDFPTLGDACDGPDSDQCENGTLTCRADGTGVECVNETIINITETCNNVDDDCDGNTDDGFATLGDACDGPDSDQCKNGQIVCNGTGDGVLCGPESSTDIVEICNGADDDCDGITDEGFPTLGAACDGPDSDECKNGQLVCNGAGDGVQCGVETPADIAELCNGADDDCDGQTDEDFPTKGAVCDGDDGDKCAFGTSTCKLDGSGLECVNEAPADIAELCNGVDDDCDGDTDEDFLTLGAACDGADHDGCETGTFTCSGDGSGVECINEPPSTFFETCNGADDDCDGDIDEDFPVGLPCDGADADECANGVYECNGTGDGVQCGAELITDIVEECNGIDDDCDGTTDEGFPNVGAPCDGPDDDLCENGVMVCKSDGSGTTCGTETPADIAEACTGVDDDCDGLTDEGFPLGQPCDGADSDQCENGTWTCAGDGTVECVNETVTDIVELCNGIDDDCDGVDDGTFPLGQPCDGADSDQCENGTWTCAGDGTAECVNETVTDIAEQCNGADDDCDGATDEDFPTLGDACDGPDSDLCLNGTLECNGAGDGVQCGAEVPADIVEACNGGDDDCDGQTDEDFPTLGDPCDGPDSDECKNGALECNATGDGVQCGAEDPADIVETCNGGDDDCDGQTDEDFPTLGDPCDGPDSDECKNGALECNGAGDGVQCGPEVPADIVETCNGGDDDCDGQTDEDFPTLGDPCDGPDSDACANGVLECNGAGDGVQCGTETQTDITEACNGADDDCDGQTDEDFPTLGDACDGPDADSCKNGQFECNGLGTGVQCGVETGGATAETCNGLDDDCDGDTDEDFPTLGTACDGPDGDSCANGVYECRADGAGVVCGAESPADLKDLCNGIDDDCNGTTDEAYPDLGDACDGADADQCANGTRTCRADESGTECVNETITDIAELCNGADDDCDGQTDEDFVELGAACDGPDSDECPGGTYTCAAGGLATECINDNVGAVVESCNAIDDDCDGQTDEDFGQVGAPCDGADADGCEEGTYVCTSDGSGIQCQGDGPVAYYTFVDQTGSYAIDESGWSNDAKRQDGAAWWTSGGIAAMDFDGSDDHLKAPHAAELSISGSVTLEAWIYLDSLPSASWGYAGIVAKGNRPRNYSWYVTSTGQLHLSTGFPFCRSYTSAGALTTGAWHHIAVINPFGAVQNHRHFVDGVEMASSTSPEPTGSCAFPVTTNTKSLYIGRTEEADRWLDGRIASLAIWDRALTTTEILAHASSPWELTVGNREICDGIDNDCDSVTDEGYPTAAKEVGEGCIGVGGCGAGLVECKTAFTSQCSTDPGGSDAENEAEICDLVDNDCDGTTDEGFVYFNPGSGAARKPGQSCSAKGECGAGVVECIDPFTAGCSSGPGGGNDQSTAEICDAKDNDCDGQTDEELSWQGYLLGDACPGVGACGEGVVECSATGATTCSTLPDGSGDEAAAEVCDGVDNDCDGETDEDFAYGGIDVGAPCVGVGECGAGVVECTGLAGAACSSDPGGSDDASQPETCNGLDDDCDGLFDEDEDGFILIDTCYTGPPGTDGVGVCHSGLRICFFSAFGGWSPCFSEGLPSASDPICNGLDDDCDSLTDEDYAAIPCGIGGCANTSACVGGVEQACVPLPAAAADTVCDGEDEDCDGLTDEEYAPISCGLGVCVNASSCTGGVETPCVPLPPTGPDEDCNGIDENCNGTNDENYTDGIFCTVDVCIEGEATNAQDDALCDDANPCTDDFCQPCSGVGCGDQAGVGGGCINPVDDTNTPPNDGHDCTVDYCEDGIAYYDIMTGLCLIDELCLDPGGYAPGDGCAVCYPADSQTEWSDTLFRTSFSAPGLDGFTLEVLDGSLTWQTSTKRYALGSPSLSAYFGDPDSATYDSGERVRARMWTSERPLGPDALQQLRFSLWLQTEEFTANAQTDVLRVIARTTDPGAPADPPVDTIVWDSTTQLGGSTHGGWQSVTVDLSAMAGLNCRIGFEFDSGDEIFNDYEGAYIDDVDWVTGCCFDNFDCDDNDGCTIDQCDTSSGKALCNWIDQCSAQCVPSLPNVVIVLDRSATMADPISGGVGASRWVSTLASLGNALAEHELDLNVGALTTPDAGADPCLLAVAEVDVGFHATAAEVQAHLATVTPDAADSGLVAGLLTAHGALNLAGFTGPRDVILITDLADGEATCANLETTVQTLADDQVTVHIVGVGDNLDIDVLNALAFAGGKPRAADAQGAHFYRATTLGNLVWALGHVLDVSASEHCDAVDNDCDGGVDEGIAPRACNPECGGGGLQSCVSGAWQACSASASDELCNGKDDDCDGLTDEEWASGAKGSALGGLCSAGSGSCVAYGTYACDPFDPFGPTKCNATAGSSAPEDCNGIDDDCDGQTDENLSKLCNTECGGGFELCSGGAWTSCSIPGAEAETCNGTDDDCDGLIDTDEFGQPLERACTNGCNVGIEKCFNGVWLNCNAAEVTAEACNGLDDDCDGDTDEGLDGGALTEVCGGVVDGSAQGVCQLAARQCGAVTAGEWGPCNSVATPSEETCNGLDDDCDGVSDETLAGTALTKPCYSGNPDEPGVGTCAKGTSTCSAGSFGACVGEVGPVNETCNGLDDDCDGQIDENEGVICNTNANKPIGCYTGGCKCAKKSDGTYGCFLD